MQLAVKGPGNRLNAAYSYLTQTYGEWNGWRNSSILF